MDKHQAILIKKREKMQSIASRMKRDVMINYTDFWSQIFFGGVAISSPRGSS